MTYKKAGRPKMPLAKKLSHSIHIYLSDAMITEIEELGIKYGLQRQDVIRCCIKHSLGSIGTELEKIAKPNRRFVSLHPTPGRS